MTVTAARLLADYCQAIGQMSRGSNMVSPWLYREAKFTPCVTASLGGVNTVNKTSFNSDLTFRYLPALLSSTAPSPSALLLHKQQAPIESMPQCSPGLFNRHLYNPLTDINWKQGGELNPDFYRKLKGRSDQTATASVLPKCQANSAFARQMINDSIMRAQLTKGDSEMALALLGCRLSVFQNTWLNSQWPQLAVDNGQHKAAVQLDIFYWTYYAIACFLQGSRVKDKLHLKVGGSNGHPFEYHQSLKQILSITGDESQSEHLWLAHIDKTFASSARDELKDFIRYRPGRIAAHAKLTCGVDDSREIIDIQAFKSSPWFKLNKAAEYHTHWLQQQLRQRGYLEVSTIQTLGDKQLWLLD